jgi:hypothetical protein
LIWLILPVIGFGICLGKRPVLILAMVFMELFSFGLHQFVHHERIYFGRLPILVFCGTVAMVLLVVAYIYNV